MSIFLVVRLKVFAGGSTHVVQLPKLLTVLDGKEGLEFPLGPNRMYKIFPIMVINNANPLSMKAVRGGVATCSRDYSADNSSRNLAARAPRLRSRVGM